MSRILPVFTTLVLLSACSQTTSKPGPLSFAAFTEKEGASPLDPSCSGDCVSKRKEFRYVVYVAKEIYCYWDEKRAETQTDFDALAKSLEQEITSETTSSQYFRILRRWAASFHDGHVNVMLGDDPTSLEIYSAPIRLQVLAPATDHEKVVVVSGSGKISAGDEVSAINGKPTKEALDAAELLSSGSTSRMRRFFASRRLVDVVGSDLGAEGLTITVGTGGAGVTENIPRNIEIDVKPTDAAKTETESTGAELIKASLLPSGIGYLRIDGFSGSQDEFLLGQAMDRLQNTRGLILDLRKNGGGDLSGNVIISRLAKAQVIRYKRSERMSPFIFASRPDTALLSWGPGSLFADWHDLFVSPEKHYAGPVIALTSPNCFSACDTFASSLQANGLATIVGEGTGGGTGTPLVFELPVSGLHFRYSVIRGQTAKGLAMEGVGTLPDVVAEPVLSDLAGKKDSQIEKAIDVLKAKLAPSPAPTPEVPTPQIAAALSALDSVWAQTQDRSPTRSEDLAIKAIAPWDEISK